MRKIKNKISALPPKGIADLLDKHYTSKKIRILEGLALGKDKMAEFILGEATLLEASNDRNKQAIGRIKLTNLIDKHLEDFEKYHVPSSNLVAFHIGVEIDLLMSEYLGIESIFADKLNKIAANSGDTVKNVLDGCVELNIDHERVFSDEYIFKWKNILNHFASGLVKMFCYNEPVFNQKTLIELIDNDEKNYNVDIEEGISLGQIQEIEFAEFVRRKIIDFKKYMVEAVEKYPTESNGTIKYIKSNITKLDNMLKVHRKFVDTGEC